MRAVIVAHVDRAKERRLRLLQPRQPSIASPPVRICRQVPWSKRAAEGAWAIAAARSRCGDPMMPSEKAPRARSAPCAEAVRLTQTRSEGGSIETELTAVASIA